MPDLMKTLNDPTSSLEARVDARRQIEAVLARHTGASLVANRRGVWVIAQAA